MEYDKITGQVSVETTPEGVVRRTFDPATGRLERTLGELGGEVLSRTAYDYDVLGRLSAVEAHAVGGTDLSVSDRTVYAYDDLGRRLSQTRFLGQGSGDDVHERYAYDDLGRLLSTRISRGETWDGVGTWEEGEPLLSQEAGWQQLGYDASGRLLSQTQRQWASETTPPTRQRRRLAETELTWSYDGQGRLATEKFVGHLLLSVLYSGRPVIGVAVMNSLQSGKFDYHYI